jgi:hypothetical protein
MSALQSNRWWVRKGLARFQLLAHSTRFQYAGQCRVIRKPFRERSEQFGGKVGKKQKANQDEERDGEHVKCCEFFRRNALISKSDGCNGNITEPECVRERQGIVDSSLDPVHHSSSQRKHGEHRQTEPKQERGYALGKSSKIQTQEQVIDHGLDIQTGSRIEPDEADYGYETAYVNEHLPFKCLGNRSSVSASAAGAADASTAPTTVGGNSGSLAATRRRADDRQEERPQRGTLVIN